MANITAADVNKLRQMTGAGMMDCKRALIEAEGDFEQAIDILRKKGQKVATKRQERDANEGIVLGKTNAANNFGAILMLNCESDFVAKNQDFINLANQIIDLAVEKKPSNLDALKELLLNGRTVSDQITNLTGITGEKMGLAHYETIEAPAVFVYNHHSLRVGSVLGLNKVGVNNLDEIGKELTMQVTAMNPVAVDKDDVDAKTIEREIEIGKEQARQEGKPEEMVEKIAIGKLNRFYKDNTLLNQDYVKDNKKTVRQVIAEYDKDLTVTGFRRLALGE